MSPLITATKLSVEALSAMYIHGAVICCILMVMSMCPFLHLFRLLSSYAHFAQCTVRILEPYRGQGGPWQGSDPGKGQGVTPGPLLYRSARDQGVDPGTLSRLEARGQGETPCPLASSKARVPGSLPVPRRGHPPTRVSLLFYIYWYPAP